MTVKLLPSLLTFLGGVQLLRQRLHLLLQSPVLLLRSGSFLPGLRHLDAGLMEFLLTTGSTVFDSVVMNS